MANPKPQRPLAAPVTCLQKRQCHAASTRSRMGRSQGLPKHTGLTTYTMATAGAQGARKAESLAELSGRLLESAGSPGRCLLGLTGPLLGLTGPRAKKPEKTEEKANASASAFDKLDLTCCARPGLVSRPGSRSGLVGGLSDSEAQRFSEAPFQDDGHGAGGLKSQGREGARAGSGTAASLMAMRARSARATGRPPRTCRARSQRSASRSAACKGPSLRRTFRVAAHAAVPAAQLVLGASRSRPCAS